MAIDKAAAKQNIADRLAGFPRYHPVSTGLLTDWRIEPGDMLTVQNDGTDYPVPVFTMDMDWKGGTIIDVQSTGSKKRPDPAKLNKGGYGGGRQKETEELQLIRHQADIEKSDTRLTLWATEEQWDLIQGQYVETHKTQLDLTSDDINAVASQTGVVPGVKYFNPAKAYAIGDLVTYGFPPITYRFTTAHAAGTPWDSTQVETVKTQEARITETSDRITAEVRRALDAESTLQSGLDIKADSAALYSVMDNDGNVTAASVATAINFTTGQSLVALTADHIEMSGSVIASRLSGEDVTFGDCTVNGTLTGQLSGNVEGDLNGDVIGEDHVGYFQSGLYVGSTLASVGDGIAAVQIVETSTGSGTYRLQFKKYGDTSWTDDTTTFSRATGQASISGSWDGGGTYTITSVPPATSGSKIYVRPTVRLTGSGSENFTAEIMSDDETPVAQSNHVYGYLDIDGSGSSSMVKVYNQRDEEVENPGHYAYSGVIAQISVGDVYTEGVTDGTVAGKNAVTINKGTWSNGTVAFSKSEGTADTKSVHLVNATPTWSGTTATVAVWDGAAAQAGSGFDTGHKVTLDVSGFITTRPTITSNGTYTPSSPYIGFSSVTVNVSSGSHNASSSRVGTYSTRSAMDEAAKADNGGVAPTITSLGSSGGANYVLIKTTCSTSKKYYFVH